MREPGKILLSALKITETVTELVAKLSGPAFEEFGAILGDSMHVYRVKNFINTLQKTEKLLNDAGLNANAVPPRLLLPIFECSSVEDNDYLQRLWAGLLATASQHSDSVPPAFIETLKQLTPDEARHFDHVFKNWIMHRKRKHKLDWSISPYAFTERDGAPKGVLSESFERLGLLAKSYDVNLKNNLSSNPPPNSIEEAVDGVDAEVVYALHFTKYAVNFMKACIGPKSQK